MSISGWIPANGSDIERPGDATVQYNVHVACNYNVHVVSSPTAVLIEGE